MTHTKPLRVLLIEDNASHALLIIEFLESAPRLRIIAEHASSVADGLALLDDEPFDLLLLDLNLPDSKAQETLETVQEYARETTIIVLTALDDLNQALLAVQYGAQDYLVKGDLSPQLLSRAIQYALERKRYAAELERSNLELQQFAGRLAHEVKNPLFGIQLALQSVLDVDGLGDEKREALEQAGQMTERLLAMVREMLDFARVGGEVQREPVDMNRLVDQVIAEVRSGDDRARIERDALPAVNGDPLQLRVLFQNLLANAVKYNAADEPRVDIRAESGDDGGQWRFMVRDNGIGIDPEDRERVFQLFQRAHGDAYAGTGIGLAYCKQIVGAHGGTIWVEPVPDGGSSFIFTLPVMPVSTPA